MTDLLIRQGGTWGPFGFNFEDYFLYRFSFSRTVGGARDGDVVISRSAIPQPPIISTDLQPALLNKLSSRSIPSINGSSIDRVDMWYEGNVADATIRFELSSFSNTFNIDFSGHGRYKQLSAAERLGLSNSRGAAWYVDNGDYRPDVTRIGFNYIYDISGITFDPPTE